MTNSIQAEPGEAIEVYLLVTRPARSVAAVEFKVTPPANAAMWGFACPIAGSMLLLDGGDVQAAWGHSPQPAADVLHALTFIIRMTDALPGYFHLGPSWVPSFSVNATRTPVEPETWGGVKALFRS